jgi:hypothetical protein
LPSLFTGGYITSATVLDEGNLAYKVFKRPKKIPYTSGKSAPPQRIYVHIYHRRRSSKSFIT